MKKLISILLVTVMLFSTLALTVAAAPEFTNDLPDKLLADANGNKLNPTYMNDAADYDPNKGLYVDEYGSANLIVFKDQPLNKNVIEATFKGETTAYNNGLNCVAIAFGLNIKDGSNTSITKGKTYYALILERGRKIYITRVGDGFMEANDFGNSVNNKNMVGNEVVWAADDSIATQFSTKGITIKIEWDENYNFKAYLNGELKIEVQDTADKKPTLGSDYGVYLFSEGYSKIGLTSFVAGKVGSGSTPTPTPTPTPETGDATVVVSLIALVAAMGTGIVIVKKRRFN